jgi:hypothetical protein
MVETKLQRFPQIHVTILWLKEKYNFTQDPQFKLTLGLEHLLIDPSQ